MAYDTAMALWKHFQDFKPLLGFTSMYNWTRNPTMIFLLEFSWAKALQDLTEKSVIAWTFMACQKHAFVTFMAPGRPGVNMAEEDLTPERLQKQIQAIREFNQAQNQEGCFINKMICCKHPTMEKILAKGGISEVGCIGSCVIYDRHYEKKHKWQGMNDKQDLYSSGLGTQQLTEKEVLINVHDIGHLSKKEDLAKTMELTLQEFINQHSSKKLPPLEERQIKITARNCLSMVLLAQHPAVAEYLCKDIINLSVKVHGQDNHGKLFFTSTVHKLAATEISSKFKILSVCDQPDQAKGQAAQSGGSYSSNVGNGGSSSSAAAAAEPSERSHQLLQNKSFPKVDRMD